jgi:tetratricopeptide (TPR) repeat protein
MPSFDPFRIFYSVIGTLQDFLHNNFLSKWIRRSGRSRRSNNKSSAGRVSFDFWGALKRSFLVRWMMSLLDFLSVIPQYLDSRIGGAAKKSGKVGSLGNSLQMFYQAVFVEPVHLLIKLIGVSFRWFRTRQWLRISLALIPTFLLTGAIFSVWYGSRLDSRGALAKWYRELGELEIEQWEKSMGAGKASQGALADQAKAEDGTQAEEEESATISSFAEMLYRRTQLLDPSRDNQIGIAVALMQRGAISKGQNILKRLAPDNETQYPRAHAYMALSYLVEFMRTRDSKLLKPFQHHAEASWEWGGTHKDVLIMSGDLHWQNGQVDKAIACYKRAAESAPESNVLLFQRALAAGQPRLAELARERGIRYFETDLNRYPGKVETIVQLAMLQAADESGAQEAEELITKAQAVNPNPIYVRALSEIYRQRFLNVARANQNIAAGFVYLDRAMVLDPSNPLVAEFMELMVRQGSKEGTQLQTALNELLVTGQATTGTHAMLAELHLQNEELPKALVHLEQVFKVAPSAVKYVNHLSRCYAAMGDFDKALRVANQTKELLQKSRRTSEKYEKYADDLLETVGKVYQQKQQYSEAAEAYKECLAINPNRAETRRLLARVYRATGDETSAAQQDALASQIEAKAQELTAFQRAAAADKPLESDSTSQQPPNAESASTADEDSASPATGPQSEDPDTVDQED